MLKRTIAWVLVLAILVGFTYVDYGKKKQQENAVTINTYTDNDSYGKGIMAVFEERREKSKGLNVQKTDSLEKADVLFTRDYTKLNLNQDYEIIAYSPMLISLPYQVEYHKKGLLNGIEEAGARVDFKKIIDAVLQEKNWSYFGGEDIPIKVYCPKADTYEGELFYHLLLITINNGKYPSEEETMKKCEQTAKEFLASDRVQEVNIVERLSKQKNIGEDVYVMTESNYFDIWAATVDNLKPFAGYPIETVIGEVYYQTNANVPEIFEKELKKAPFVGWSTFERITRGQYYRTSSYGGPWQYIYGITDGFSYIEIPKERLRSISSN